MTYSAPMTWEITVAGTVHLDDITTPHGRREDQCGGSAVYFSLAAARSAPVHFYGIVGSDSAPRFHAILENLPVELAGMTVSDTPTFRWHAVHDFEKWVALEIAAEPGCDPEWRPTFTPEAAAAPVLFLGSMSPTIQADLLRQSRARLIGADSMTVFIGPEHEIVEHVVASSDVLFLNRTELAALVPGSADDWQTRALALLERGGRLRAVVVKAGPEGAALVTRDSVVERPAAPVARVTDPTGAGDALAGGFLGACAAAERDDNEFFVAALEAGLACAAAAIGEFGTVGLARLGASPRASR